ncbi:hypothetical protein L484_011699 [Morus notabilis]|uniref:ALOG domain-containing protein n=1 Tax=Morus notabilis TaxID=981085 RepID=W9R4G5_9ROSA|nr:protein LIGHT-DEPENDENT SHORT HYPOCOTYLS 5 [Morus notabilis]EXB37974.1 hypothetical protein L484_011699 [Morus notabilis]
MDSASGGEGSSSASGAAGGPTSDPSSTQGPSSGTGSAQTATSSDQGGPSTAQQQGPSRYESQKRRDWNTFLQYLKNHKPPLTLVRCSGAHVIEFLKYLDQFGKTKVHVSGCPYFGHPNPPAPCACPLKQAWGSLDALIGRLRAAYEENGGRPESNPFGARAVRIYLREVREGQAKARGIPYEKKKRKRSTSTSTTAAAVEVAAGGSSGGAGGGGEGSGSGGATAPGGDHDSGGGAAVATAETTTT